MPSKKKKGAKQQQSTSLVPHGVPDLHQLLEKATTGKVAAVREYLVHGDPSAIVRVQHDGAELAMTLLHAFILCHHDEVIESIALLKEAGAAMNATIVNHKGNDRTALMWAAEMQTASVVRALLQAGADPFKQSETDGFTALHLAAVCARSDIVEMMLTLAKKCEPDVCCSDGSTAIATAAASSHSGTGAVIDCLVRHGANVNLADRHGECAIHAAAAANNCEAVRALARHGADLRAGASGGRNALHFAACAGNIEVLKLLHGQLGVALHEGDTVTSETLLMHAASKGHTAIVKYLLSRGVPLDIGDARSNSTALQWCTAAGDFPQVIQLLLDGGADLHRPDAFGFDALATAVCKDRPSAAAVLLAAGARVTPLCFLKCAQKGLPAMVTLLAQSGGGGGGAAAAASVNSFTYACHCCGWSTALMAACDAPTAQALLAAGADVHAVSETHRYTCLHTAAVHKRPAAVVCVLIKAGADLRAKCEAGLTAADRARISGSLLLAALLDRAAEQH